MLSMKLFVSGLAAASAIQMMDGEANKLAGHGTLSTNDEECAHDAIYVPGHGFTNDQVPLDAVFAWLYHINDYVKDMTKDTEEELDIFEDHLEHILEHHTHCKTYIMDEKLERLLKLLELLADGEIHTSIPSDHRFKYYVKNKFSKDTEKNPEWKAFCVCNWVDKVGCGEDTFFVCIGEDDVDDYKEERLGIQQALIKMAGHN